MHLIVSVPEFFYLLYLFMYTATPSFMGIIRSFFCFCFFLKSYKKKQQQKTFMCDGTEMGFLYSFKSCYPFPMYSHGNILID